MNRLFCKLDYQVIIWKDQFDHEMDIAKENTFKHFDLLFTQSWCMV